MVGDITVEKTNCPNCGAVIQDDKRPFCGTLFYDLSVIPFDTPFVLRLKLPNGQVVETKAYLTNAEIEQNFTDFVDCRDVSGRVSPRIYAPQTSEITLRFSSYGTVKQYIQA